MPVPFIDHAFSPKKKIKQVEMSRKAMDNFKASLTSSFKLLRIFKSRSENVIVGSKYSIIQNVGSSCKFKHGLIPIPDNNISKQQANPAKLTNATEYYGCESRCFPSVFCEVDHYDCDPNQE